MPSSTVAAAASVERPSPRSLRCTRSDTVSGQKPSQAIESSLPPLSAVFASPVVPPSSFEGSQLAADWLLAAGSGFFAGLFLAFFAFFLASADLLVRRFSRLSFSATGSELLPNDQRSVLGAGKGRLRFSHSAAGVQLRLKRHDSPVSEA